MKNENVEKPLEYANQVLSQLKEMFTQELVEELSEGDNLNHFFHAIMNLVPNHFFEMFTKNEITYLESNHIANALCFEYMISTDSDKTHIEEEE